MAWLLTLVLLLAPAGHAQTKKQTTPPPAKPPIQTDWPLVALNLEGNKIYPTSRLLAMTGLKIGQIVNKAVFEAARDRLVATGAFSRVDFHFEPDPAGKGFTGTFQVFELEEVLPYRFDDLPAPEPSLRDYLHQRETLFIDKIPATQEILTRCAAEIQEFLKSTPFNDKVVAKVISDPDLVVVFRPNKPPAVIGEVKFTGNNILPTYLLQNTLSGVAIGVPYSEPRVRQLLESSIRPLYEARGRVRVSFPKVSAEKAKDVDGMVVSIEVNEGPSYDMGEIRFDGTSFASEELLKIANWKPGDISNFDEIQAGLERIYKRYRHDGYLRPSATVERKYDDTGKKVDLVVHITLGAVYRFGKVAFEGLDLDGEAAVRKMWGMKPGSPFNADYPDYFLQRIKEEDLFENLKKTRSETKVDEAAHTVDVTLYFR